MPTGTYLSVPGSDVLSVEEALSFEIEADPAIEVGRSDNDLIMVPACTDDVIRVPK